ncbi:MAG TPA: flavodoxin-dependent (E)-4-hydroxy-3-methylbut-2-enyl-diphosphate synthase, partial [Daejeonella sp.]|nr:flavodoxin-dependent (E)-4-hydroxy-3-methylbut-2-enyl-diphosphate synthase [Daejeonella sp.]
LGDTIRVSLTEDPEFEAPVAIALANRYHNRLNTTDPTDVLRTTIAENALPVNFSPYVFNKRKTTELNTFIGGHQVPRVIVDISKENLKDPAVLAGVGYVYSAVLDKYNMGEQSTDFVYLADELPSFSLPGNLKQLYNYQTWKSLADKANCHPLYNLKEFLEADLRDQALNLVSISNQDIHGDLFDQVKPDNTLVFVLETNSKHGLADQRQAFFKFMEAGIEVPVIISRKYNNELNDSEAEYLNTPEDFQLYAATDLGGLLLDGLGDGIWAQASSIPLKTILTTSFGILQATRSRISKTEYISCPSCGRTLFDLQETTQMIRSRTDHLKGLKIGIMGCIVNGPGEMADADYGYVGTGPGKITLYRGKEVVKKNVNTENALDELIDIIREDGNWIEVES